MGGKPVIVSLHMHNPTVPVEFEPIADAILVDFSVNTPVLLDVLFGDRTASGRLPYNLPRDMAAVERHGEDDIQGPEPYVASNGDVYKVDFKA